VANLPTKEFWTPGSTLRINMDNANPLAFGMPQQALATFLQGNHAYEVIPTATNEKVERIATFVDRDILQSGWLLGEDRIAKKAAVVAVQQDLALTDVGMGSGVTEPAVPAEHGRHETAALPAPEPPQEDQGASPAPAPQADPASEG